MIASDRLVSIEEVGDSLCKVVNHKRALSMNLPVVVGFSILQLAKLRMLKFYYDCIDCFVDRKDFQYAEMDTDSAYVALSAPLENILKPGMERSISKARMLWMTLLVSNILRGILSSPQQSNFPDNLNLF